jgi:carboxyl-terminal processing protease
MIVTAGIMTTNLLLPVEYLANTDYTGVFSHTNLRLNEFAVAAAVSSEESRVVGEAWKILDKAFVDKKRLEQRASQVCATRLQNTEESYTVIHEMTALLGDKFTRFLTPAQYETLQSKYTADAPAAGLVVELSLDAQGRVVVGGVNPGSPAAKAGISTGDVVRSIDNQLTEGLSADEVAAMMRGKAGTAVAVTLAGMDGSNRAFTVERATLSAASVTSKLQGRIGVIKIPTFAKTTAKATTAAVSGLLDKGAETLILDLRGNLGGYFPAGVELAKELLPPVRALPPKSLNPKP